MKNKTIVLSHRPKKVAQTRLLLFATHYTIVGPHAPLIDSHEPWEDLLATTSQNC